MSLVSEERLDRARDLIYRNGRLIERQLFALFIEEGSKEACLKVLLAYQNADGGFGNGLEPDLLCPDSTAIGAETALYVLDVLDAGDAECVEPLIGWIVTHQNGDGVIEHPPENLVRYPHQPWWASPDDDRILVLAGILRKWGVESTELYAGARRHYMRTDVPETASFYGYPLFCYLKYCAETHEDRARFAKMVADLPAILEKYSDHYPLFGRYWYHAQEHVDDSTLKASALGFVEAMQEDGGVINPYPDLPWWRPIFTLDGLVLMQKRGML